MNRSGGVRVSSHRIPHLVQLLVVSPGTREYHQYFGASHPQIGFNVQSHPRPRIRPDRETPTRPRLRPSLSEKCYQAPQKSYVKTNEILVSHIISPDEIYVQHTCSLDSFQLMMDGMQKSAANCESISLPLTGMGCIAKWPYDDCYYRCRITDVTVNDIGIQFMDYGDCTRIDRFQNDCKVINAAQSCRPFFAEKVKLAGVVPRNGKEVWEEETKEKFIKFFEQETDTFIMEVVDHALDSIKVVKLTCPDGKDLSWHLFQLGIVDLIKQTSLGLETQNDNAQGLKQGDSDREILRTIETGTIQNNSEDLSPGNSCNVHGIATEIPRAADTTQPHKLDVLTPESTMASVNVTHPAEGSLPDRSPETQISSTVPDVQVVTKTEVICISSDESEDEELVEADKEAENYVDYRPVKIEGARHPNPVVETASLASVTLPDIWYNSFLPKKSIDSGALSAMQLEAIIYACQRHERKLPDGSRAGYLVGDGAGTGKGRIAAGIIFENYHRGRKKAIWVSASNDLKYDAERDLRDIGADQVTVYSLNKMKYHDISGTACSLETLGEGVIFCAYSNLIGESRSVGTSQTRLEQLFAWFRVEFDGVIIFDECHNEVKKLAISQVKKRDLAVSLLQTKLPNARVVYISTTGVSEPRKMVYMVRLGLWGQGTSFTEFSNFVEAVERSKTGDVEAMAQKMKQCGMYIARHLSYKDVNFKIKEVVLSPKFAKVYGNSVKLWAELRKCFTDAADLVKTNPTERKTMWVQFWLAHQRFFKYLCISVKVSYAVKIASEAVKCGKCVVIGLQSTGEARTLEQIDCDGELSEFVSPTKRILLSLVQKHFPTQNRSKIASSRDTTLIDVMDVSLECSERANRSCGTKRKNGSQLTDNSEKKKKAESTEHTSESEMSETDVNPDEKLHEPDKKIDEDQMNLREKASWIKKQLLEEIEKFGAMLPRNALDQLVDELGGPENVAEITERKGRVVQKDNGLVQYGSRSETGVTLEKINLLEKERFMSGTKKIAIISEAVSSGISLHADRRVQNQRCRLHIPLELPLDSERTLQQLGRTQRSNQVTTPEYIFLVSDLAGERLFASVIANRLRSLGAVTGGSVFKTSDRYGFEIDTKDGQAALDAIMKAIIGSEKPVVPPPADYRGDFFKDLKIALIHVGLVCRGERSSRTLALDKDYTNISKFCNRILGIPIELQTRIFKYFTDTISVMTTQSKKQKLCC